MNPKHRRRRRLARTPLRLETLEHRTLLAGATFIDGKLDVAADADESIRVGADKDGKVEVFLNNQRVDIKDKDGNAITGGVPGRDLDGMKVNGGPLGNDIDLQGVDGRNFPGLAGSFFGIDAKGIVFNKPRIEIDGKGGNDNIKGGPLGEKILGGAGMDSIMAGGGPDKVEADAEDVVVDGGKGKNQLLVNQPANNQPLFLNLLDAKAGVFTAQIGADPPTQFLNFKDARFKGTGGDVTTNLPNADNSFSFKQDATGGTFTDENGFTWNIELLAKILFNGNEKKDQAVFQPGNSPINFDGKGGDDASRTVTTPDTANVNVANVEDSKDLLKEIFIPRIEVTKTCEETVFVGDLIHYVVTIKNLSGQNILIDLDDLLDPRTYGFKNEGGDDIDTDFEKDELDISVDFVVANDVPLVAGQTITARYTAKTFAAGTVFNDLSVEHELGVVNLLFDNPIIGGAGCLTVVKDRPKTGNQAVSVDPKTGNTSTDDEDEPSSTEVTRAGKNPLFTSFYSNLDSLIQNVTDTLHGYQGDPVMVDVAPDGVTSGNGFTTSMSSDARGRFVAMQTTATNLAAGVTDANNALDVYLRDLVDGVTVLVSRNRNDPTQAANNSSTRPLVSPDGRYVFFESRATNLVATPLNNTQTNLYRYTIATGAIELVNLNTASTGSSNAGTGGDFASSFDGEVVAFTSIATDLTNDAKNNGQFETNLFRKDLRTGVTTLVSKNHLNTGSSNRNSFSPKVSADGGKVFFVSNSSDIVNLPDGNDAGPFNRQDIFFFDAASGMNELVSINAAGTASGNGLSVLPAITPDGQFVAFQSSASNLVTGVAGLTNANIYVRDVVNDATEIMSVDPTGATAGNSASTGPSISDDARFIFFSSTATNLSSEADSPNTSDVFVRNRVADLTTLISRTLAGAAAANNSFAGPISADGSKVFYSSTSSQLVNNDVNQGTDVFESDAHRVFEYQAAAGQDNLMLLRDGADYVVRDGGGQTVFARRPAAATDRIVIRGQENIRDLLTIAFDSGPFNLTDGINWAGGAGDNNRLLTLGNNEMETVLYAPVDGASGIAEFDGVIVSYTGLENIDDRVVAMDRVFDATALAPAQVRLRDDQTPANGQSHLDGNTVQSFTPIDFANPTRSLNLVGSAQNDVLFADGLDSLFGANVSLNFFGRGGDDILDVSAIAHAALLAGGEGNDILRGSAAGDVLSDGPGNDQVNGNAGDDFYSSTPGSDDAFTDTAGNDTLDFSLANAAVTLDLDAQTNQTVDAAGNKIMLNGVFENLIGSIFNDVITARALNVVRNINLNPQVADLAPGDHLKVDAQNLQATNDGAKVNVEGRAAVNYADVENVELLNVGGPPPAGPRLEVDDVVVAENAGRAAFNVRLITDAPIGQPVTVDFATANNTAVAPQDYRATQGRLTFRPNGPTTLPVNVPIVNDSLNEAAETFFLRLANAVNAAISDNEAVGTILPDNADAPPRIRINDVTVTEKAGGTMAAFTAKLSKASGQVVTVDFATNNGSAVAPGDYGHQQGMLTFNPGERMKTVVVPIPDDLLDEANETFTVDLASPVNATIQDGQGKGTIKDNDPRPGLTIADAQVFPGGENVILEFIVTLSAPSGTTVTVGFATANGTARAGQDFVATNDTTAGKLVFNPGETTKMVRVTILPNTEGEGIETFMVSLRSPLNAAILDGKAVGTILALQG